MTMRLARLTVLCALVVAMVTGSASAFWTTCTSTHDSMSSIAINTPYDITTEAGRDTSDPYYYYIQYGELALYSLVTGGSGDGEWHFKDVNATASHTWSVQNEEHDIYVSWQSRINVYNGQNFTYVTTVASSNPGPFYTP